MFPFYTIYRKGKNFFLALQLGASMQLSDLVQSFRAEDLKPAVVISTSCWR